MSTITLANGSFLDCSRPLVMGIINCTPDSFAVRCVTVSDAVAVADRMIEEGADILDIGGESSRPGSEPVGVDVETGRVLPVIEKIRSFSKIPISIDTIKAAVAEKALTAGADIVNDISAMTYDPEMAAIVSRYDCPVVLMHIRGTPKTMQDNPGYDDVIKEVEQYFTERIEYAGSKGISIEKIILDPGIGFGKRTVDNLTLIKYLNRFAKFGRPLMIGASRKRFIGEISRVGDDIDKRLDGSLAVAAMAVQNGACIVRTHDVAQTCRAVAMAGAINEV